jgi:exodeoxyribonuclease V gamma subunit
MTLHLHTSNRLDILADRLAAVMAGPPASPLAPEIIVVQSRGMQRWLSLRIARSLGICANCVYPFPNAFFADTLRDCLPGQPDTRPFERDVLAWRLMGLLSHEPAASVAAYLQDDAGLKRYQLACRIADTFDQYAVFRPDMLAAWEKGKLCYENDSEELWQAELWQSLGAQNRGMHRGRLLADFLAAIEKEGACRGRLPERVAIFGIAALPPYHLQFFDALARSRDVHLFLLNPCREYWGAIMTEKQAGRAARRANDRTEELHMERGNSLLASMGGYGREFYDQLLALDAADHDAFEQGGEDSLLACIQSDILNLRDRGADGEEKTAIARGDRSLQIHSCHSPMREAEVLYSSLLRLFEEDPGLAPHDILVMTPDLETCGPFVQAVFSSPEDELKRVPVSLADRSFLHAYPLYEAVLHLLSLGQSRFGAPQVMQVLEAPSVQRRLGLSEGDLDLIKRWIIETRIRWGRDATSRSQDDLPAFGENTWEAGLDRLLLGYAMPAGGKLFAGILPYDAMEGGSAQVLGRFAEFLEALFDLAGRLRGDKTLSQWAGLLQQMLDRFFAPEDDDETYTIRNIQEACAGLGRAAELSGFDAGVPLEVVREHLEKAFSQKATSAGFLTGAVTVCAMLPMRSIPFKVICLLGMNDGLFPRVARPPAFDLIARYPRPCDRSAKKDDRYLFLETIISARSLLYISYTGQNVADNSVLPPSTVVSELMDYIDQGFILPEGQHLVTKHRLQPFSPAYFRGGDLFSYSLRDYHCAKSIAAGAAAETLPFIGQALSEPEESFRTVTLDSLAQFLVNPAQYLLQKRLDIFFEKGDDLLDDREPFSLDGLERYGLEKDLLEHVLTGSDPEELYPVARASGILPHDMVGRQLFEDTRSAVERFAEQASPYISKAGAEAVPIALDFGPFRITGTLEGVCEGKQVLYRHARATAKDFMHAWIYHLALCANGAGHETLLFSLDKDRKPESWRFGEIESPGTMLQQLLELYWQGLQRPLPLFPKASLAFAEKPLKESGDERKALWAGQDAFEGNNFNAGDAGDPYIRCCFRDGEFDEQEFIALARSVYAPMIEHRSKL